MLFTDSHSVSALRSVTDSEKTRQILRQDTPGESRSGVEMLSDVMEQAVAAPRFRKHPPYRNDTPPRAFELRPRSPAIGAGARIPRDATRDFFGVRIPRSAKPDIGFAQAR